ncbi:WhiB family transcriptional regulator [Corynebacterium sphenisci]|uniref:WhiB family transcriptional regulator n=1 Tax=Corynebacterium sphenisci TaxID=191493 RepID=UPI0026E035EC|nr:WhiB family transcriptional regulator [Corynebacterium sphenisci]MDO5730817.1 WhiB family transcriptional regulator [Corynebacterium sphenisci]
MLRWQEEAKCAGDDPGRYVLDEEPHRVPPAQRGPQARALCDGCPVRAFCAADALDHDDIGVVRAGVWIPAVIPGPRGAVQRALLAEAHRRWR